MSESALEWRLDREAKEARVAETARLETAVREHPVFKEAQAEADRLRGALERVTARVEASPSQWIKREFRACLRTDMDIILTITLNGVRIGDQDFVEGLPVTVPMADADRLITANLAKESTHDA